MSKDKAITAVRALLDDLEANWATRLQEIDPESNSRYGGSGTPKAGRPETDRVVMEAIGIGRAQIIADVRKLLDNLEVDEGIAQSSFRTDDAVPHARDRQIDRQLRPRRGIGPR